MGPAASARAIGGRGSASCAGRRGGAAASTSRRATPTSGPPRAMRLAGARRHCVGGVVRVVESGGMGVVTASGDGECPRTGAPPPTGRTPRRDGRRALRCTASRYRPADEIQAADAVDPGRAVRRAGRSPRRTGARRRAPDRACPRCAIGYVDHRLPSGRQEDSECTGQRTRMTFEPADPRVREHPRSRNRPCRPRPCAGKSFRSTDERME